MQVKFLNNQIKAQHFRGVPPSEIMVPYPNINSLLESQANFYKDKIFIKIENEEMSYIDFYKKVNQHSNYLNKKKLKKKLFSVSNSNPIFFLIEIFSVWNNGGVVDLDSEIEKKLNFEKIFKDFKPNFSPNKKNKFYDICIKINGRQKNKIFLSHYNLLITAMGMSKNFNSKYENFFIYQYPFKEKLNLILAIILALYLGNSLEFIKKNCEINSKNKTTLFSEQYYSNNKIENIILPHNIKINQKHKNFRIGLFLPEVSGYASINIKKPKIHLENFFSIGKGMNHCELSIFNKNGSIESNNIGELVVRGHNIVQRIEGDDSIENYFKFGWFHTGIKGIKFNNEFFIKL